MAHASYSWRACARAGKESERDEESSYRGKPRRRRGSCAAKDRGGREVGGTAAPSWPRWPSRGTARGPAKTNGTGTTSTRRGRRERRGETPRGESRRTRTREKRARREREKKSETSGGRRGRMRRNRLDDTDGDEAGARTTRARTAANAPARRTRNVAIDARCAFSTDPLARRRFATPPRTPDAEGRPRARPLPRLAASPPSPPPSILEYANAAPPASLGVGGTPSPVPPSRPRAWRATRGSWICPPAQKWQTRVRVSLEAEPPAGFVDKNPTKNGRGTPTRFAVTPAAAVAPCGSARGSARWRRRSDHDRRRETTRKRRRWTSRESTNTATTIGGAATVAREDEPQHPSLVSAPAVEQSSGAPVTMHAAEARSRRYSTRALRRHVMHTKTREETP